jgi:threonine/homoserine/homoserine lactone efflux protein
MVAVYTTIFLGAFVIALSGALMPGPLLTVTVAGAAKRGMIVGPLLILGHAVLELALVVGVVYGLGGWLKLPLVMAIIAGAGGGVLLWMGGSMVHSASGMSLNTEPKSSVLRMHPVLFGILGSVTNPFWVLWWATIGLGYLIAALKTSWIGVACFFMGHISADFLWYCAVAWGVSRGRKIVKQNVYQWAIRVCGVFLFFFGGWFIWTAVAYLRYGVRP